MKQIILLLLIQSSWCFINAQDVAAYFTNKVAQDQYSYTTEREIIANYKTNKLIGQLEGYLNDSIESIQNRSYYLLSLKAREASTSLKHQQKITQLFLEGIERQVSSHRQITTYLRFMPPAAFDLKSKMLLENIISSDAIKEKNELILLAGYCGTAENWLKQTFLLPQISPKEKWTIALALSRQGSEAHTSYCLEQVRRLQVDSRFVDIIVPSLIYTHNKQLLDFCVELLYDAEKLCVSANADNSAKISCGYPMMHLLAPVIKDFPYQIDGSGTIASDDYEQALITIQEWFTSHPNYEIININY